jgi:hypothetical protein
MDKQKQNDQAPNRNEVGDDKEKVQKAHKEADRDIAADPEFSAHSPKDDLDEEESARLGNNTPLV